jgi:hypothetical protein
MPIISALRRLLQEYCEFKNSLGYHSKTLLPKMQNKNASKMQMNPFYYFIKMFILCFRKYFVKTYIYTTVSLYFSKH